MQGGPDCGGRARRLLPGPAGRETLLFDTGLNLFRRSRSALVDNAEALDVDLAQVPAVVLSHEHEDHVGGVRA